MGGPEKLRQSKLQVGRKRCHLKGPVGIANRRWAYGRCSSV